MSCTYNYIFLYMFTYIKNIYFKSLHRTLLLQNCKISTYQMARPDIVYPSFNFVSLTDCMMTSVDICHVLCIITLVTLRYTFQWYVKIFSKHSDNNQAISYNSCFLWKESLYLILTPLL